YRVRVVTSLGVALHDSGWRQGDATEFMLPSLDWTNGAAYQALVQVAQTGGSASDYGTSDFTTTWDTPIVPTVTATPGADGVQVVLVADPFVRLQVQRIRPDGTWADLTTTTSPDYAATFAWTGTPGASTSTLSRGGVVAAENLVTTPSFEYGLGNWVARSGCTVTREVETLPGGVGGYSARVVPGSTTPSGNIFSVPAAAFPVTPGGAVAFAG